MDDENEDFASIHVSGSDATETTRMVAAGDDGSDNSYDVYDEGLTGQHGVRDDIYHRVGVVERPVG